MMDKLLGFAPDMDPTTPGVIVSCVNLIPGQTGMMGAPVGQTPLDAPALAAECRGAAVIAKLDDTRRIIAGTQTKLYELSSGAWADVSRVGDYVGGSESTWSFCQFGDTTIAANGVEILQSSASGDFADIAGAPIADVVFSVGAFVMALATNEGTYGDQANRWWCSASFDATSWTPDLATQCATGLLVSAPGPILAGGRLGEYAIVYKQRSIYLGQYVGAPEVWNFTQVPGGEAGCVGKDAWCDIGAAHFFVGVDNFYLFDGTRPVPVGVGVVRDWFFLNSEPSSMYLIQCKYDRKTNSVWIFYPAVGADVCNQALVYHIATKQWGCVTLTIEAALDYISAGTTIDGMDDVSATIDGLTEYAFDSQYWLAGGRSLSIFNSSHQLQLMTGATVSSGLTTGDIGDDERYTIVRKIRARFAPGFAPTAATCRMYGKATEGAGLTAGQTATMTDASFHVLHSARFHRMDFAFTGPVKVLALGVDVKAQGRF